MRGTRSPGNMTNAYQILVGKREGNRQPGRPRCRWENSIRKNLTEIRWEGVDWMHLARDGDQWRAVANTVMTLGSHKRQGISGLAEWLSASREQSCAVKLLSQLVSSGEAFQPKYSIHFSYIASAFLSSSSHSVEHSLPWEANGHSAIQEIPRPALPSGLFPSDFPTKNFVFFISPMRATCPTNLILFYLMTTVVLAQACIIIIIIIIIIIVIIRVCVIEIEGAVLMAPLLKHVTLK